MKSCIILESKATYKNRKTLFKFYQFLIYEKDVSTMGKMLKSKIFFDKSKPNAYKQVNLNSVSHLAIGKMGEY